MRFFSLLFFGALSAATINDALAGEYYRWVDEKGTVHFSDTRPAFSVELEIELDSFPLPENAGSDVLAPPTPAAPPAPDSPDTPPSATSIRLLSPADQDTLRDNQGTIKLNIATDLPLGDNQRIRAVMDERDIGILQGDSLTLNNVDRGEHTIKVQLLQDGKVIAASPSITVYLHRATVKNTLPPGKPSPR